MDCSDGEDVFLGMRLWACAVADEEGRMRVCARAGKPLITERTDDLPKLREVAAAIARDRAVEVFVVELEEVGTEKIEGERILKIVK